jgi:hypothetical protein
LQAPLLRVGILLAGVAPFTTVVKGDDILLVIERALMIGFSCPHADGLLV